MLRLTIGFSVAAAFSASWWPWVMRSFVYASTPPPRA